MSTLVTVVAYCLGIAFALGLFIVAVAWASGRLSRQAATSSKPVSPEPYTDRTEQDASFLAGDFDPEDAWSRLRADIEAARADAADPTSPANLRPIPGQRNGENR